MINAVKYFCIGLVVGALSAFFYARDHYRSDAQIAALTAQNAALSADLIIAKSAEFRSKQSAEAISETNQANEELINALLEDLEKRHEEDSCNLNNSDAGFLRDIK